MATYSLIAKPMGRLSSPAFEKFQGLGIGSWCMQEYERMARVEVCGAIRLDAYDKHLSLLAWYEKLGYHWRGTFAFHTRLYGETGMACYEKMKRDFHDVL